MKIAIDASALSAKAQGISRYLDSVLERLVEKAVGHEWILYGRDRSLRDRGAAAGARTFVRADGLPAHVGRLVSLATSQPSWLRRDRPDVFWSPAHRFPAWLPAKTARVVTIHDVCWDRAPQTMRPATRWLDAVLMPRALRQADRIIAASGSTRDDLCARFPGVSDRIVVVHEAASPGPPPLSREALSSWGLQAPYVLFVGTLEPRKNLTRLVQAFAQIVSALPHQPTLAIAGAPGWGDVDVEAESTRLGISERVRVLGRVDDAALATLYAHAELLALPSLYEGFGLPLLEALAHGTPVLYGDNSSMPEVAGDAGLGVNAESVDSVAEGLSRMLTDGSLRKTLASRAKAQAARFSWDRAASETLTVFQEAIQVRREKLLRAR